ncbi:hypothetical protein GOP47_0023715 [Adiantum capillus-veneris]|uniref:AP2/ERF domain-containing protein n=2 Tax=Euphyllophyta TaxID=78536 RepID=A0A9D4Z4T8_ADICA|nr:hypothetical protein GOP47_0023715 [Adiantum capillus-veneris]
MESSFTALYDPTRNKDTSFNVHEILAKVAAGVAENGLEKAVQEEGGGGREEEQEDDFEEEGEHHGERVSNKEIEEPTYSVPANPPSLAQCEPQRHPQRSAKRSRPSTAKERISKMPPCAAGKRSSIYRGVTRHRWTGRYEAHLWDKSTWNETQNKKGKQVYLGAYDEEEAAARAYDLAALKYWGPGTLINFPVSDYARDIDEMQSVSREDYLALLRRKSSGFSRVSKMKIGRNHSNARWDTQAGGSFASTLPMFGGYDTVRDGVGRTSLDYGALGCPPVGMINLSHFMNWLQPPNLSSEMMHSNISKKLSNFMEEDYSSEEHSSQRSTTCAEEYSDCSNEHEERCRGNKPPECCEPYQLPSLGLCNGGSKLVISALSALSQSSMFARMEQGLNAAKGSEETAARKPSESATAALAAALAMEDCAQSQELEMACSLDQNNVNAVVHLASLRAEAPALAPAMYITLQYKQRSHAWSLEYIRASDKHKHGYDLLVQEAAATRGLHVRSSGPKDSSVKRKDDHVKHNRSRFYPFMGRCRKWVCSIGCCYTWIIKANTVSCIRQEARMDHFE